MLQVQDIYRRDFSSHFRATILKDRALCDKVKLSYKMNGRKTSEQQLKYMLLEWGREFKNLYIDAPDAHTFDIVKEAENFIIAKLVKQKLIGK